MKKPNHTRPKAKKARYKVTNWSEYNRSLIQRGKIIFWIPLSVLNNWFYEGKCQRGGQFEYSDTCIELFLTLKVLFRLGYRQTQGFLESIFEIWDIDLPVPSFSDVCKRSSKIKINEKGYKRKDREDGLRLSADSTGLKVYGEGEWKVRSHGWSKHRTWRKLHMLVNPDDNIILGNELTENSIDDADIVEPLLNQVDENIESFTADGAYDKTKVYKSLESRKITPIIPPRKNARISKHGNCKGKQNPRDKNIRKIRRHGRTKWKIKSGYHRRSLSETNMFRYKLIIGDKLKSRNFGNQKTESKIACKILNTMAKCGMPNSIKINHDDAA